MRDKGTGHAEGRDKENVLTRRDFLRGATRAVAAAALGLPAMSCRAEGTATRIAQAGAGAEGASAAQRAAKVVLVRDEAAVSAAGELNFDVVGRMLDDAVTALEGTDSSAAAWGQLIKPDDLVGIKSNVWAPLRTPPELERILVERAVAVGVPAEKIRVTDRQARQMLSECTALINCRPARAHHWSGMGGCIKNYIVFSDRPSQYHDNACESLALAWELFGVKEKTRLNILLVLTPQFYARGPHNYDPQYVWPYRGILVSHDPVAADAVGAELLRRKRVLVFGEDPPMTPTLHIAAADTKYGLGVADLSRIELVKIGWAEDLLLG